MAQMIAPSYPCYNRFKIYTTGFMCYTFRRNPIDFLMTLWKIKMGRFGVCGGRWVWIFPQWEETFRFLIAMTNQPTLTGISSIVGSNCNASKHAFAAQIFWHDFNKTLYFKILSLCKAIPLSHIYIYLLNYNKYFNALDNRVIFCYRACDLIKKTVG